MGLGDWAGLLERKEDMKTLADIGKMIRDRDLNYYLIYGIGICGFLIPGMNLVMRILTPPVLFITALHAMSDEYLRREKGRVQFIVWVFSVFTFTMFLEILGVNYGLVFGEYVYGRYMGPGLLGVPLIIGLNWIVVAASATALAKPANLNPIFTGLLAGTIALIFDIIMEPAAIGLGFWDWGGAIPLKNYVSWFVITFAFSSISCFAGIDISGKKIRHLFTAQFGFFVVIRIFIYLNLM